MAEPAQRPWEQHYRVTSTEIIVETPKLRVLEVCLAAGEEVPWHLHRRVEDIFYCLEGVLEIRTRKPEATTWLNCGQSHRVPAGRAHRVLNAREGEGASRFLIVQGPGEYDYVPIPED